MGVGYMDDFKCRRSQTEMQFSSNNIRLLDDIEL